MSAIVVKCAGVGWYHKAVKGKNGGETALSVVPIDLYLIRVDELLLCVAWMLSQKEAGRNGR